MAPLGFQFQHLPCIVATASNGSNDSRKVGKSKSDGISSNARLSPRSLQLMLPHASSSSISSSDAQYSEQLLDAQRERRRKRRIAGIDQDELVDPMLLADPDSCFCEFNGVHIHHKVYQSSSQHELTTATTIQFPLLLLHGFGASLFSWNRVVNRLTELTSSKVLAFDRPAFGLTSRVPSSYANGDGAKPLNPYSMAFSVLATLYFIDFLAADKAVLVGHSAGSIVAMKSYFEAPERVAALILVAPAILAPSSVQKVVNGEQGSHQIKEETQSSEVHRNSFSRLTNMLSTFSKYIVEAIMRMAKLMTDMLNSLYRKALSAILRSAFAAVLVRMAIDKFGVAAIRSAWYDSKQVTEHVLQGYTKPLKSKGWDTALIEYTAAMFLNFESEPKPPLEKRLHEISCPVLIVTGDTDRIVPSWNAETLSRAIPGSCLEVIKHCGHLPHEEKVEEFVSVVRKFLLGACGNIKQ